VASAGSGYRIVLDFCGPGNELLVFTKAKNFVKSSTTVRFRKELCFTELDSCC
jgi:hypothetical protein